MVKILIDFIKCIQGSPMKAENPAFIQVHLLRDVFPGIPANIALSQQIRVSLVQHIIDTNHCLRSHSNQAVQFRAQTKFQVRNAGKLVRKIRRNASVNTVPVIAHPTKSIDALLHGLQLVFKRAYSQLQMPYLLQKFPSCHRYHPFRILLPIPGRA